MIEKSSLDLDKRLIYLSGSTILVDNIPIVSIKIKEIIDMGFSKYMALIQYICCDIDDLIDNSNGEYSSQHIYPIMIYRLKENEEYKELLCSALSLVCGENEIIFNPNTEQFQIGNGILNKDNFLKFQAIVKERNGISKIDEAIENPADAKTASLLAKRKAMNKKLMKAKKTSNGIELDDLISILAVGLNQNIQDICNYDMYQLKILIDRIRMFKDYEDSIRAMLAGAEKVDIKHWMSTANIT